VIKSLDWQIELSKDKGSIQQLVRYGFSDLKKIVLHNGMVSGTREDTKCIAFSRLPKRIVLKSKRKKVDNL